MSRPWKCKSFRQIQELWALYEVVKSVRIYFKAIGARKSLPVLFATTVALTLDMNFLNLIHCSCYIWKINSINTTHFQFPTNSLHRGL